MIKECLLEIEVILIENVVDISIKKYSHLFYIHKVSIP